MHRACGSFFQSHKLGVYICKELIQARMRKETNVLRQLSPLRSNVFKTIIRSVQEHAYVLRQVSLLRFNIFGTIRNRTIARSISEHAYVLGQVFQNSSRTRDPELVLSIYQCLSWNPFQQRLLIQLQSILLKKIFQYSCS